MAATLVQPTASPTTIKENQSPKEDNTEEMYRKGIEFLVSWWSSTEQLRKRMRASFQFVDGNHWTEKEVSDMLREGRPAVTMNEMLPHINLLSGVQRKMELEYLTNPKGLEDRRFSEIGSAVLKATQEFGKFSRVHNNVFDKGIIAGMGVSECSHTFDDAEDLVWGDITLEHIFPLNFIFDPWAGKDNFQDGRFMGKLVWMDEEEFKHKFPGSPFPSDSDDWTNSLRGIFDDESLLGTAESLQKEMFDSQTGRARVAFIWFKDIVQKWFVIDNQSGDTTVGSSRQEAEKALSQIINDKVKEEFGFLKALPIPEGVVIVDTEVNQPMTQELFQTIEEAQSIIDNLKNEFKAELRDRYTVVPRSVKIPKRMALTSLGVVKVERTPFNHRFFPYSVYVSRRYTNEIESIQGIVFQEIDGLKEINKRYSNLLAHLNNSAHSGWFNRSSGGANSKMLATVGSKPGLVVEYTAVKPEQIRPVDISQGHFLLLSSNIDGIRRRTGINDELLGQTTQTTVSGRAINARQQGGLTANTSRLVSFEEYLLDEAEIVLKMIQQFYPPEKIKRIIGLYELNNPLGEAGRPLFTDPQGNPISETEQYALLEKFKMLRYDLSLKLSPKSQTQRQTEWEKMVELTGLLASTGRTPGPALMNVLADAADVSQKFVEAFKQDMETEVNAAALLKQDPSEAFNKTISNIRSGKAGSNTEPKDQLT